MCGITGFFNPESGNVDNIILEKMSSAIESRGPDDSGIWRDIDSGIGFAHRRLAIQDLSKEGHQPMQSARNRYVIVFNGEIYNHYQLRSLLEREQSAILWRGHSDTETLLAGFDHWGIEKTIKNCIGMFAFAVWDKKNRTVTLGRDRLGEKPLYYGWQNGVFLFGSELKALKAHPEFQNTIDCDALTLYLHHGYIPAPHSIFLGINKLLPSRLLTLSIDQKKTISTQYWSVSEVAVSGISTPFSGSSTEAIDTLEDILVDAIQQQMLSDVPLGAFLSGGVDSSLIVALMQRQRTERIKTFSIGFYEDKYNEAVYAKSVAEHLGTDHTELYLSADKCMDIIPLLPSLYDEPFSDNSQIPTYLVSKLASEHVTVSLSGDAGDELFAGYNNYFIADNLWSKLSKFPLSLRKIASKLIPLISPSTYDSVFNLLQKRSATGFGLKIHKGANILHSRNIEDLHRNMTTCWHNAESIVLNNNESIAPILQTVPELLSLGNIEKMMLLDLLVYLPDDILCKVDRAAMGVSLETRVPFLDHRVVEFAWRLPMKYKFREGQTKWTLRQILYQYVPKKMIERPKKGFSVPIDIWLREPLREWAENLLDRNRLQQDGYFNPTLIRQKWEEHLSGKRNWHTQLWSVLMFNQWLDMQ